MSRAEHPALLARAREGRLTVEEVAALVGASTPHFALQLAERVRALILLLPEGHPARAYGAREVARLEELAITGEERDERPAGAQAVEEPPLPSLSA